MSVSDDDEWLEEFRRYQRLEELRRECEEDDEEDVDIENVIVRG